MMNSKIWITFILVFSLIAPFYASFEVNDSAVVTSTSDTSVDVEATSTQPQIQEEVKCVFSNSGGIQKCYTDTETFSCSGKETCVTTVSGTTGTKVTWKSTCGGYAYTTIDGNTEYAEFNCAATTPQSTEIKNPVCSDSERETTPETTGTLTSTDTSLFWHGYKDYCINDKKLVEITCSKDKTWYSYEYVDCATRGEVCKEGVCVKTDATTITSSQTTTTATLLIRAIDQDTLEGQSNDGVVVGVITNVFPTNVLGKGTTTRSGVKFEIPLDTKFYVSSYYSKDGKYYVHPGLHYVKKSDSGFELCNAETTVCRNSIEIILEAKPQIKEGKIIVEKALKTIYDTVSDVFVVVVDKDGNAAAGVKIAAYYSETDKQSDAAVTNANGEAKINVLDGRIFYVISSDSSRSEKHIIKLNNVEKKLCDLVTNECTQTLVIKMREGSGTENISPTPSVPSAYTPETYTVYAKTGWNLLSAPMSVGEVKMHSCGVVKAYLYDGMSHKFKRVDLSNLRVTSMQAFWVKSSQECKIDFVGSVFESQDVNSVSLGKGWNMIGAAKNEASFDEVKGTCDAASGPWSFDPTENKWSRSSTLVSGMGYFVKVSDRCELGSSDLPPLPPN